MISIRKLDQFYGSTQILWDLNLEVPEGSCTCIMGRNGVGKTTLLKCLMGLLPVSAGEIFLDGEPLHTRPAHNRARSGIAYVPQGRDIFPQLTVEENLRIGLPCRTDGAKELPDEIFELFPVLQEMLERRGGDLSGGQQQQLAIARALVIDPRVLILDEPNEGIQPSIVNQIGEVIIHLVDKGLTVLLVEQKLGFARRVGREFRLMKKGRIVAADAMDNLDDSLIREHLAV
ncbi:MAG: urea ABC transporter ATP-binding subunit UrtE [Gammaproteobacteria bacterium]|nr:urea ABC transporter ATP-binding subunit UrtE [Gammaproteobacteria bacterium]